MSTQDDKWVKVIFAVDCDEDGNCPQCGEDFGECGCPGPTMDEYEYRFDGYGQMWARRLPDALDS